MAKDWVQWHRTYDDPNSSLSRRLEVVRRDLRRALAVAPGDEDGAQRLISLCAGDGRDVLPILAEIDSFHRVAALLVELDPTLSERARTTARKLGLRAVEVRTADAGVTDPYREAAPAHVVLACGVFGNVSAEDADRTISALPSLLTTGGIVIWTRGRGGDGIDRSLGIRGSFLSAGFRELSFTALDNDRVRVGMHQLEAKPDALQPPDRGTRLFTFV
jgi:hypothetical protein